MKPSDFRILVAEDDVILLYLTSKALRDHGYEVLEARDGAEALWIGKNHEGTPFHLLVTDVNMPSMSGDQLVRELKATTPDILVMVVSGVHPDNLPIEIVQHVACALQKPVLEASLLARVAALLGA